MKKYEQPRKAFICTQGWAGRIETPILVIGQTPTKYEIQAIERTKLGGASSYLAAGETAKVPKYAVRFEEKQETE